MAYSFIFIILVYLGLIYNKLCPFCTREEVHRYYFYTLIQFICNASLNHIRGGVRINFFKLAKVRKKGLISSKHLLGKDERWIWFPHQCPIPLSTNMECTLGLKKSEACVYEASFIIFQESPSKLKTITPFMKLVPRPLI